MGFVVAPFEFANVLICFVWTDDHVAHQAALVFHVVADICRLEFSDILPHTGMNPE